MYASFGGILHYVTIHLLGPNFEGFRVVVKLNLERM